MEPSSGAQFGEGFGHGAEHLALSLEAYLAG